VLDPQDVALAGHKQDQRLSRRRPTRQPAYARADALLAAHQQRVAPMVLHNLSERMPAAREFGIGKTPIRGIQDRRDLWIAQHVTVHGVPSSRSRCRFRIPKAGAARS
jgi:hypothetical protein